MGLFGLSSIEVANSLIFEIDLNQWVFCIFFQRLPYFCCLNLIVQSQIILTNLFHFSLQCKIWFPMLKFGKLFESNQGKTLVIRRICYLSKNHMSKDDGSRKLICIHSFLFSVTHVRIYLKLLHTYVYILQLFAINLTLQLISFHLAQVFLGQLFKPLFEVTFARQNQIHHFYTFESRDYLLWIYQTYFCEIIFLTEHFYSFCCTFSSLFLLNDKKVFLYLPQTTDK